MKARPAIRSEVGQKYNYAYQEKNTDMAFFILVLLQLPVCIFALANAQ
jgi:hypothetical protein